MMKSSKNKTKKSKTITSDKNEKLKHVWKTSDLKSPEHAKQRIPYKAVLRLYGKLNKHEYKHESIFWLIAKFGLPFVISILLFISVTGIILNFTNVSASIVRFAAASNTSSQNEIKIMINAHNWARIANDNKFITYSKSNTYSFVFKDRAAKEKALWKNIEHQFETLYDKIKIIANKHHCFTTRLKNNKFNKDDKTDVDYISQIQKILNLGIDFNPIQMAFYDISPHANANHVSNDPPLPPSDAFYQSLYVVPVVKQHIIHYNSLLLPTPTLDFQIDSHFKTFSGQSKFIQAFKYDVNQLLITLKNDNTDSSFGYFGSANYTNSAPAGLSNITSVLPIYNIKSTSHSESVLYFRNTMIAIIIIFVIILIYILFRYRINNVLSTLAGGISLILILFPLLTLLFPISIPVYTILILMMLLFLFNTGYFTHQSSKHLRSYEANSHFVFAKKNDIKKIAFDILMQMKRVILLQLATFCGFGAILASAFLLPVYKTNVDNFVIYGVLMIIATLATVGMFVFGFVFVWIQCAYHYLNLKKAYVINSLLYSQKANTEQMMPGINDFWEEINIKRLLFFNPELKSIMPLQPTLVGSTTTETGETTATVDEIIRTQESEKQASDAQVDTDEQKLLDQANEPVIDKNNVLVTTDVDQNVETDQGAIDNELLHLAPEQSIKEHRVVVISNDVHPNKQADAPVVKLTPTPVVKLVTKGQKELTSTVTVTHDHVLAAHSTTSNKLLKKDVDIKRAINKSITKKTVTTEIVPKKPTLKKSLAKKTISKKDTTKKEVSMEIVPKKQTLKKALAKKSVTKKETAKKEVTTEIVPKKQTLKKALAKKSVTKKETVKKTTASDDKVKSKSKIATKINTKQ